MKYIWYSAIAFFLPLIAHAKSGIQAAEVPLKKVADKAGITESDPGAVVGTIIAGVLTLVGVIFLALMVYAGILWMTARGKDDQIEKARNIIIASVIGLFIVVSAYAITAFVTGKFS